MRRWLLFALALVVLAVGTLLLTGAPSSTVPYSIQQLDHGVRLHPRAWIGRTVTVRAVGLTYFWGSGHGLVAGHQAFLIDPPFSGVFVSRAYAAPTPQLNGAGVAASLLLAGPLPPPSSGNRLLLLLAQVPFLGRLVGASPPSTSELYRIRIVRAGPCPQAFSGFCPTGVAAS